MQYLQAEPLLVAPTTAARSRALLHAGLPLVRKRGLSEGDINGAEAYRGMFANREDDRDPWARAILCSFEPYSRVGHLAALPQVCLYANFAAHLFKVLHAVEYTYNSMRPYP